MVRVSLRDAERARNRPLTQDEAKTPDYGSDVAENAWMTDSEPGPFLVDAQDACPSKGAGGYVGDYAPNTARCISGVAFDSHASNSLSLMLASL